MQEPIFDPSALPPIIMEVESGSLNISFLSFRAVSHYHDYGRKSNFNFKVTKTELLLVHCHYFGDVEESRGSIKIHHGKMTIWIYIYSQMLIAVQHCTTIVAIIYSTS